MAFGVKTNEGARAGVHAPGERPGTRAQVKYVRMSAYKARVVLDLIRGKDVAEADAILQHTPREAARVVRKCLASAVANAANNDGIDPETLYVSACFADEGMTIKRWRPRARGRATRIRKRTCHITVIVSPYTPEELEKRRRRDEARGASGRRARTAAEARAARVARSRQAQQQLEEATGDEPAVTESEAAVDEAIGAADEPEAAEPEAAEPEAAEPADETAADASASEPAAPAEAGAERRPEPADQQEQK